MNFGFFNQFLTDEDGEEDEDHDLKTDVMGMLNPQKPMSFGEKHIMSAIFEPIKDDVKPMETYAGGEKNAFSQYANMEEPQNENWRFG